MPDRTPLFTGGCQCGAVRFAVFAQPRAGICHCRMCQKAVGGPFYAWGMVAAEDFAWTKGAPAMFRSSSAAERGFCAQCGTPLCFRYDRKQEFRDFSLASLDQPGAVTPTVVLGVESQLPWCNAALFDLPGHKTGELGSPEDLTKIRNFQHPDHE